MRRNARCCSPSAAAVAAGLFVGAALMTACRSTEAPPPTPATTASAPTPLTWENIFAAQRGVRQAALSPDGRLVAVSAVGHERTGIFLVPTGAEAEPPAPTFLADGNAPVWFRDGSRLLLAHDNDLWTRVVAGGAGAAAAAVRVTHDAFDERWPVVSPDGTTVAFFSTRPRTDAGSRAVPDPSPSLDLWLVAADGSGPPRPLTSGAMAADDPRFAAAWSPDGRQLAYISNAADYWEDDVWIVDAASGASRQVSRTLMASSAPVWSPDGRSIALLGTAKNEYWYEDLAYIYVLDVASGAERRVAMQVYGTDWLHSLPIVWSADGTQIFFQYLERGAFDLWTVPAAGGVATRVTHLGGAVRGFDASRAADAFVVVRATATRGPDVDYVDSAGGPARRLTQFAQEWEGLQEPEEISYRSFDGLYIQGFLYRPPDVGDARAGSRRPALVMVHGGGTNSYLRGQNLIEQTLASKGYVVLAINYRGGSGFGRAFQDLSVNDWANGQAHDAAAAADFIRRQPWSNGKVGIYGYSYGGITSMAAIARWPKAFDAAVPMAGIYDFADAYTNADRVGKIFIRTGHGGSPEERPAIYAISNTLARLPQVQTPLLVMHGEADVRAPYAQFRLATDILRQHGKVFEQQSYPGEPHGFRNPANRVDMYQRLERFFASHLGGTTP